jgi:two-component system, NarL family, response regulator NreC
LIDGLRALFEREPEFQVIGDTTVRQAAYSGPRIGVEVVVVDLLIQILDGPALIARIRKRLPEAKIVVLSISRDSLYASKVMAAGASAYVLKSESFAELMRAIWLTIAGVRHLSPQLDARAVEEYERNATDRIDRFGTLTARERQVLQLTAEGHTSAQIASQLGIGRRTVETHRANIYAKVPIASQMDLIALALRHGLFTPDI